MQSVNDGVFNIGHASALARINRQLFLFDPVWGNPQLSPLWRFYPEQIDCSMRSLWGVHGSFISHEHPDHLNLGILVQTNRKVMLLDERPALEAKLQGLHTVTYPERSWLPVGFGVEAYFVRHPTNNVDSCVFVRSKDFCFFHGNDCFLPRETLLQIRKDIARVDVAMLPYAYIGWYPQLQEGISEERRHNEIGRLNLKHLCMAHDFMNIFQPQFAVPAGASIYYDDGWDHILNTSLVQPSAVHGGTELAPGEFISQINGTCMAIRSPKKYKPHLREVLGERRLPPIDSSVDLASYNFDWLRPKRQQFQALNLAGHRLSINGVPFGYYQEPPDKETQFDFDKEDFHRWATQQASMEELIGRRRFKFSRTPDVYDLKVLEFLRSL